MSSDNQDKSIDDQRAEIISRYRKTITDHLRSQRSEIGATEANLKKSIRSLEQQIEKAESRVAKAPDDMESVFYSQIRKCREQKQAAQVKLGTLARIAAVSAEALAAEAQKIVNELRNIREAIHRDDPVIVRSALASIIDRIELTSKPAKTSRP